MHPQPRMQDKKAYELVTTGSPKQSGIPCANGFNGVLRALPGVHDLLVTVASRVIPRTIFRKTEAKYFTRRVWTDRANQLVSNGPGGEPALTRTSCWSHEASAPARA